MPAQAVPAGSAPPPTQAPPRDMEGQVKAVGAVQLVFATFALIASLVILFSGSFAAQAIEEEGNEPEAADLVRALMGVLGIVLLVYAGLGIAGSVGLFMLAGWGRGMSLAFCGISLIQLPFGTALGIWGLIVLTRPETTHLFRRARGATA